jgi:hypothetical protein
MKEQDRMHIHQFDPERGDWQQHPLGSPAGIGFDDQGRFTAGPPADKILARLHPFSDSYGKQRWAMIVFDKGNRVLHLNGMTPFSLHVLQDRDELSAAGQKLYFSSEQVVQIEKFELAKGQQPLNCPRCKDVIEAGTPAVKCPACGLWFHESEELGLTCWSYDAKCLCGHSTKGGEGWKPPVPRPKIKLRVRKNEPEKSKR